VRVMGLLAAAIVLSVVLYLIDKNKKWGVFWRLVGSAAFLALVGLGYLWYDDYRGAKLSAQDECGKKVLAAWPDYGRGPDPKGGFAAWKASQVFDRGNVAAVRSLGKKMLAQYPNCDAPPWIVEPGTKPKDGAKP
jgi:hypothetical protein